jgi:hypothetical protein
MSSGNLTRRFVLLLPLAFAACGEDEEPVFQPLRYTDLPPIQLNVASIAIEQHFVPAGVPPDVSTQSPEAPAEALKAMAKDRLQAFGTANKAVFAVLDASLTRENDVLIGLMAVSLTILDDSGAQLGFAEARVQTRHTGRINDLRSVLYDMTKNMMVDMNIEFEYQIRHNLKNWLTSTTAPDTPVQQAPLNQSSPEQVPADQNPADQAPRDQLPPNQSPPDQTPTYQTPSAAPADQPPQ